MWLLTVKIVVIFGGDSSEREVSLISGSEINNALKEQDKNTNTLEDDELLAKGIDDNLINSKSTVLSTMPTHLKWIKDKGVVFDDNGIPKLVDANYAGGPKSGQCTIILCEGDSAKAGIISGLAK